MKFEVEVRNVDGTTQRVQCIQTAYAFVMDPTECEDGEIRAISASPDTKELQITRRNGSKQCYNSSTDPKHIAISIDWGLNGCNPVPDIYIDGVGISDWSYYKRQRNSLFGAVMRKMAALGLPNDAALHWAGRATSTYTRLILVQKGIDLRAAIPKDMMENDMRYDELRRERLLRA